VLRKVLIIGGAGLLVAALAWSIGGRLWNTWPKGLLAASGRIEGDEAVLAPKIAGQVVQIFKDKGELANIGDLLARLSSDQIAAQLKQAQDLETYWQQRLDQARIDLEYTRGHVRASIDAAQAQVGAAGAQSEEARALYDRAQKDYHRYQALLARRVIPQQQMDGAKANFESGAAVLSARGKLLKEAQARLVQARLLEKTVAAKEADYQATQAQLQAAQARVKEAQANLADTEIRSPIRGVILTREAEPGLVVSPGTPLFTMVNLDKLYLKVYIPEAEVGRIRLGQEARIYVDAYPDQGFDGRVYRVSQRAEFTPKYVETREERINLVFGVELLAYNPEGYLKPGMPADGVIRLKDGVPWRRPR
jgi:HlyD family secretion protein